MDSHSQPEQSLNLFDADNDVNIFAEFFFRFRVIFFTIFLPSIYLFKAMVMSYSDFCSFLSKNVNKNMQCNVI